jgi:hypothetical protein
MKVAVEHIFNGATGTYLGFTGGVPAVGVTAGYDSTKALLGSLMKQYTGPNPEDKYASVVPSAMINIPEAATFTYYMPHVIKRTDDIYWVFMGTNATAAATRNISLFEFNAAEAAITHKGYITMSGTTITGNKTIRGLRAFVYTHTTGTVSTSGSSTTLSGSSTGFQTERIAAGARIGFGTTDPLQVTEWYKIDSITNDTTLTLDRAADISAGTSYVIEEIRILVACTNATLTNGGPHLIKGLNYNTFSVSGTVISEASTTDNVCASYLLKDAATTTITVAMGVASDEQVSNTEHDVYVLNADTAALCRAHKFNIRAALTVSGGISTSAWVFKTGQQATTGTLNQVNNGRMITLNHLSATGEKSVFFATSTRIYRADLDDIVSGSSTWITDSMNEIPVGGVATFSLQTMNQVDYTNTLDRLVVPTTSGRFGVYFGEYDTTNSVPFERLAGINAARLKLSTTQSGAVDALFPQGIQTVWTESGYMFIGISSTTSGANTLRIFPFAADGFYADNTGQIIVTPKLATPNAQKLYRVYIEHEEFAGSYEFGFPPDTYRTYYRTSGIDDNSGSWTLIPVGGDMTGIAPGSFIQFMFKLDTLGETSVPAKIYSVCCVYEDNSQDNHYQPSLSKSSAANNRFAWKQVLTWGGTIPNLQLRLYNAANEFLVLDDDVDGSAYGTWEYSTDGTTWNAWSSSADTVGNYIRYTATTLPNNITVRALLTQA